MDGSALPEVNDTMRRVLLQQGVPPWFLTRAFSTPSKEMWYPTPDQLVSAHVITKLVNSGDFAVSGLGALERDGLQEALLKIPVYEAIKSSEPSSYNKISERFGTGVRDGRSGAELKNALRQVITSEVLPKYLKSGSTRSLVQYWKVQMYEAALLAKQSPALCVQFFFSDASAVALDLNSLLPTEVVQADSEALTDLIRNGTVNVSEYPVEVALEQLGLILQQETARFAEFNDVIVNPKSYFDRPGTLCSVYLKFYQDVLALPEERSGHVLRHLVSQ